MKPSHKLEPSGVPFESQPRASFYLRRSAATGCPRPMQINKREDPYVSPGVRSSVGLSLPEPLIRDLMIVELCPLFVDWHSVPYKSFESCSLNPEG